MVLKSLPSDSYLYFSYKIKCIDCVLMFLSYQQPLCISNIKVCEGFTYSNPLVIFSLTNLNFSLGIYLHILLLSKIKNVLPSIHS